ncbi:zwei Ig domain protein zig-8-like [Pseudomyrmex gracilis]|uniref:zwei Ig domain protein zig-8-like n=1 Tax=Pseudomyrmex gracilis TaxID=219809 RepID=UPI0009951E4E|nr:zwei Ig domain protein zig-8-like [Pseudomyrmex gracilis]
MKVWESRIFLVLAAITIVIANYQRHRDRFHLREQLVNGHKVTRNITQLQEEIIANLPPLRIPRLRHHRVTDWDPYFENADGQGINGSQHVALHLGATAFLDCRVAMLSGKKVMWLRRNTDWASLLTLGNTTHISDSRYSVSFQYPNNWRLAISGVRREDHGVYVCQVNTHPPRMLITNVTVLAPDIRIVDEARHELRDRYYKTGSGIDLTCVVRPSCPDSRVPYPVWRKNGETLLDHVNVYHINGSNEDVVTRLYIERAKKTDSGEYTCSVSQFSTTAVHIHVLNGEKQAAVYHDQWNAARTNYPVTFVTKFCAVFANIFLYLWQNYLL